MRRRWCGSSIVVLALLACILNLNVSTAGFTFGDYRIVNVSAAGRGQFDYSFRLAITNSGAAAEGVAASLVKAPPGIVVIDGSVVFGHVPAGATVASSDTFVLRQSGKGVIDTRFLEWAVQAKPANTPPQASAGPDQSIFVGTRVQLDGSGSSDADGNQLSYVWSLVSKPADSHAALADGRTASPSFFVDRPGTYRAELVVNDGIVDGAAAGVTIKTRNRQPVADAGADQTAAVSSTVRLDGSPSSDVDGDRLTFGWSLVSRPPRSEATLSTDSEVTPTFVVDTPGQYEARLVVNDGTLSSRPDTVTIDTTNSAPQANAGSNELVPVGGVVHLSGASSSDVDGDPLSYFWSLQSVPEGSSAALSGAREPATSFVADRPGRYVARLVVSDGHQRSAASLVTVDTTGSPPVSNAGADQTVAVGANVPLDGSGSTDLDGGPLSYLWSLIGQPDGSIASVSDLTSAMPSLVIDLPGVYVAQLVVSDGATFSPPSTVTITTSNSRPVANAGPTQSLSIGQEVLLDGAGSIDADGDPLTFRWAVVSRPARSVASLQSASGMQQRFVADEPGSYVVQLIVNDGHSDSAPHTVTLTTIAATPVADARFDSVGSHGVVVQLDGSASFDPDLDPLTYSWSLLSKPVGSVAVLSDPTAVNPTFAIDRPGTYVAQLIVTGGGENSPPDTVAINHSVLGLIANAGPDQVVDIGATAQLDGTASSAAQTYDWAFDSKPAGSAAALSNPASATPNFVADVPGDYVVRLVISDGSVSSTPDTVTISTSPPGVSLSPSSLSLTAGGNATLTVSMPGSGTGLRPPIMLSSSNPSVVTVPATVTIPAGQSSTTVQVTAGSNGGAVITASIGAALPPGRSVVAVGNRLVEWIKDASGLWEDPSNWSGNQVPGNGDVVLIDRPAGNFVVTVQSATAAIQSLYAAEDLVVSGQLVVNGDAATSRGLVLFGTIAGNGKMNLGGPMTWNAGNVSLAGGLEVGVGQTLNIATANQHVLSGLLINRGTVVWSGGFLFAQGSSAMINALEGSWDVQGDLTLTSTSCGSPSFSNAGLLRKTAGTGPFVLASCVTMTNTGTLELQSGSLVVQSSLASSGQLRAAAATTVFLDRVTLQAGTTFYGDGTLNFNGSTTVTAPNLTISLPAVMAGTLTGPGKATLGHVMDWNGGTIGLAGGLEVGPGFTMKILTANSHVLSGPLTNHGTVQWSAGPVFFQGTIAILNASDGTWEVQDDLTMSSTSCGAPVFTNAGLLRKTLGSGSFHVTSCIVMTNTGTLDLQSGSLEVASTGLKSSGLLSAASGTTLFLDRVTLESGATISGSGLAHFNGTTTVTAPNLAMPLPMLLTGTLNGSGKMTLAAQMTWNGGNVSLTGGLEVGVGHTLTVATGNQHVLSSGPLTNHGTVLWTAGPLFLQGSISVTNASDGLWEVQDDLTVSSTSCGAPTFTNNGVLRKTAGTGSLTFTSCLVVTNTATGTLDVQNGSLVVSATALNSSGLLTAASGTTVFLDRVTLQTGATFSGSGLLHMNGTTTVTATDLPATLPMLLTGTLTGPGKVTLSAPMTWNGGTVSLTGGLIVGEAQTLSIASANQHVLASGPLTNRGKVAWSAGDIFLQGSVGVTNGTNARWEVQGDLTMSSTSCGAPTFTNNGVLLKTAGTGSLTLTSCLVVTNTATGTLDVQSGSLVVSATALTSSGLLTAASGTTVFLDRVTFQSGATFSGNGLLHMNGTTTVTAPNLNVTLPSLLTNALTGPGKVTLGAPMTWNTGSVSLTGGLEVDVGQTLTMATANQHVLFGPLTSHGTVRWTGGDFFIQGSAAVINASDGVWDAQGNLTMSSTSCGAPTFTNAGELRKSGVTGALTIASCVGLTNTGTIKLRIGGAGAGQFDSIAAAQVSLAGTLDVTLINGFSPSSGQAFGVLGYTSRTGTFAVIDGHGQSYAPSYGANALTLQVP